jgi:hypothetical protein
VRGLRSAGIAHLVPGLRSAGIARIPAGELAGRVDSPYRARATPRPGAPRLSDIGPWVREWITVRRQP